jgi:hypothetical protein
VRPLVLVAFAFACTLAHVETPKPESPVPEPRPAEQRVPKASPEAKLTVNGSRHRLELAPLAVEVDAGDGGRIVEFSREGWNAVATQADSPLAYGTSFWPSPQSDWNWPPPPEIDRLAWTPTSETQAISLESGVNAALGLAAKVRVAFASSGESVRIDYTLENRGSAARRVAPWQNTRVRPGGLTFYPARSPALPPSTLEPLVIDGVAWLLHDPKTMTENRKSFADGAEGLLAHVEAGHLFVATWNDVPRERQAPGEAEIELYVDKTGRFVEIEAQGPYEELAPGGSCVWTVFFSLERLAKATRVEPGNPALVRAARALAERARS